MKLEFRGRQPSYRRTGHPLTLTLSPKSLPMTRYLNPESLCGNDSGERGQEVEDLTLSPKSLPMTRYLNPESLCGNDSGERGQERSWLNETVSFARLARFPSRGVDLPVVRAVRHSCGGFRPLRASSRRGRYVGSSSVSSHPSNAASASPAGSAVWRCGGFRSGAECARTGQAVCDSERGAPALLSVLFRVPQQFLRQHGWQGRGTDDR